MLGAKHVSFVWFWNNGNKRLPLYCDVTVDARETPVQPRIQLLATSKKPFSKHLRANLAAVLVPVEVYALQGVVWRCNIEVFPRTVRFFLGADDPVHPSGSSDSAAKNSKSKPFGECLATA